MARQTGIVCVTIKHGRRGGMPFTNCLLNVRKKYYISAEASRRNKHEHFCAVAQELNQK
jgi:hypothetical protein